MDVKLLQLLTADETLKDHQHILLHFEKLNQEDTGWHMCGNVLANNLYEDERVKFFCLQVLKAHIKERYSKFQVEQRDAFKEYLRQWYLVCCGTKEKSFLLNKTAQILCLIFIHDYPNQWPTFFTEMLVLLNKGNLAVDLYLRTLLAVDEEVVARHVPHTQQEFERNTAIKDYMRDHCIRELVESWYQILELYEGEDPHITSACMKVIGAYVSWIDIDLIANNRFISRFLSYMNNESIREGTCDCLLEIINKGMDPQSKTRLVESLADVLVETGILFSPNAQDEESEFTTKLSVLMNGMGTQLISSFNKLTKTDIENGWKVQILEAIDKKIPAMLRFLSDDDDDVSEAMFEFCHAYLVLMKQLNGSNIVDTKKHIKDIFTVVVNKLKYGDDFDFANEGDDEIEFLEYRKLMKVVLTYLAKLDGEFFLSLIYEIINNTLSTWQQCLFKDVEVAVYILYCLSEAFQSQDLFTDAKKFTAFQTMMAMLISSNVSLHAHSAIKLQYFETVTRYERFFFSQTQHIPPVLVSFLDERGIKNSNATVSSRTCFLLARFIKALKNHILPFAEDIFHRLLSILTEQRERQVEVKLSENDCYYLYEVAAILITCTQATPQKQLSLMESLLSPIIYRFQNCLEKVSSGVIADEVELQSIAVEMHHSIAYVSRASKAFTSAQNLKASGCLSCFSDALSIFLHSLTIPVHREMIHNACRQYLHRMIICMGETLLPYIPIAVNSLLKDCEMRDIQEFIPLINQLITRFKSNIAPFLSEIFMPMVTQIFAFIQASIEPNDLQALKEKQLLQRSYFLFIATIVTSNIPQVLVNQESNSVKEILLSLTHGAVEISDPQGQKTCFVVLCKLVECWGDDVTFKDFIYESVLPSCFLAPMKSTFDLEDAQTNLVLQEISNTQKMCIRKLGHEGVAWLEKSYLPRMNCPDDVIVEYSHALQNMYAKAFKRYLRVFYARWKT